MAAHPSRRAGLSHVPALDGLRGVALLGVLFFHANGALPGGYLGVDLFFVLSGYLITSLLLAEHRETGRIVLSAFLARRARRLLPALLALMPAIALYGRFVTKSADLPALRADALATLGYVANWHTIFARKSYWELFAAPSPLEHTWSLAIEEQFYLVWPVLVALALRRRGPRSVLVLTTALMALSMGAMLALFDPAHTSRAYLGTDTRAAGLLAGAALATVMPPDTVFDARTVRGLDVLGCIAAFALGVAWWRLEGESPFLYRGGLWLTEAGVLVLIACAVAGPRSFVARALGFRPLTQLGTISYGVYLWHWPVDVLLTPERVHAGGGWLHVLQFGVTFAIAIVSYRFLERPIRRQELHFGRPIYAVPASVALSVLLVVRATSAREGVASSPPAGPPPPPAEAAADPTPDPDFKVLLLGDSTANSLGWGLRGVREPGVAVELRGQDGCTMLADLCGGPSWGQYMDDMRPNATIVFLGGAFMHGLTVKGEWEQACRRDWDNQFERTLAHRLGELKERDPHVWVVTLPYPLGPWETRAVRAQVDCINASIRRASAATGVEVLDLAERLCPKGSCQRELGNEKIRPDGVHFSIEGAADLSRWVLERVESSARQGG